MDYHSMEQENIEIMKTLCKDTGLDCQQIAKLTDMGYFRAPASKSYHGNVPGGLFDHSLEVMRALLQFTKERPLTWQKKRSPYIIGLLHDLCKCDQYITREDGSICFNKNMLFNGHGDKSCILAAGLIPDLTEEEMLCIRWHMGAFDEKENWNCYTTAIQLYPNVLYTHTADMIAANIKGK